MQFHPKDLSELDDLTEEHLGFSALSDGLGFTRNAKKAPAAPPPLALGAKAKTILCCERNLFPALEP